MSPPPGIFVVSEMHFLHSENSFPINLSARDQEKEDRTGQFQIDTASAYIGILSVCSRQENSN